MGRGVDSSVPLRREEGDWRSRERHLPVNSDVIRHETTRHVQDARQEPGI